MPVFFRLSLFGIKTWMPLGAYIRMAYAAGVNDEMGVRRRGAFQRGATKTQSREGSFIIVFELGRVV